MADIKLTTAMDGNATTCNLRVLESMTINPQQFYFLFLKTPSLSLDVRPCLEREWPCPSCPMSITCSSSGCLQLHQTLVSSQSPPLTQLETLISREAWNSLYPTPRIALFVRPLVTNLPHHRYNYISIQLHSTPRICLSVPSSGIKFARSGSRIEDNRYAWYIHASYTHQH